jgi:hypothetical protein
MPECKAAGGFFLTRGAPFMPDEVVTVAKYTDQLQAEMARVFLEGHGIPAQVSGDQAATLNFAALAGRVQLLVRKSDAPKAAALLADHFEKAELDTDWKAEAEAPSDVWVCPLCGGTTRNESNECDACHTARESIQKTPGARLQSRRPLSKDDWETQDITADQPGPAPEMLEPESEILAPNLPTLYADGLAKRAFAGAIVPLLFGGFTYIPCLFVLLYIPLTCFSMWYVVRLLFFSKGELSKSGSIYLIAALVLNFANTGLMILLLAR